MPENMKLYDFNKNLISLITDPKEVKIEKELDYDKQTLSFYVDKSQAIYHEQYIVYGGQEWVVKEVNVVNELREVVAVSNIEILTRTPVTSFITTEVGIVDTLDTLFGYIPFWSYQLSSELAADTIMMNKERTISLQRVMCIDVIASIMDTFFLEVKFDTLNQVATFYKKRGEDKGTYFTTQLNLSKIATKADTYELVTRLVPIGKDGLNISSINAGLVNVDNFQYVSKVLTAYWVDNRYTNPTHLKEDAITRLAELSKPLYGYDCTVYDLASAKPEIYSILSYDIGDTITLIDPDDDVRYVTRIMKMTSYPAFAEKNTVELESRKNRFNDIQNELIDARDTVTKTVLSDGTISIGTVEGLTNEIDTIQTYSRIILLSNESQTLLVNPDGSVPYDSALSTQITVYQAGLRIAADLVNVKLYNSLGVEIPGYAGFFSIVNPTNLTDGSVTLTLANGTNLPFDSGYINIPVVVTYNSIDTTYVKRLWWNKVYMGEDGNDGASAKVVNLTTTSYVISYNELGASPSPSGTLTITASSQNFTNAFFKFTGDGITPDATFIDGVDANTGTKTFTIPASYFSTPKTIRVGVSEGNQIEVAFDTITITAVKPGLGGSQGNPGLNAMTTVLTNEAVVLPKTTAGVVTYLGSGTAIYLYEGATELTYDASGLTNGTWKVVATPNNITVGAFSAVSGHLVVGDHSNIIGNNATISYLITGKRLDGTTFSLTKIQSISIAQQGATGTSGTPANYVTISGLQVFKYLSDDLTTPTYTSIVLTAALFGTLSGYDWEYYNGGGWTNLISGTQNQATYTLNYNDAEWGTSTTLRVRCVSGGVWDEKTITKIFDGTPVVSGYLTNEVATIPTAFDGVYDSGLLVNLGGVFVIYRGATRIMAGITFGGTATQNGLTLTINSSGVITLSGTAWSTDSEVFTLTATYGGNTITKLFKISKSKAGVAGVTLYTWIKYATDAIGSNISSDPTARPYIGFAYNKTTPTASNTPGDYIWSLIQGAAGVPGDDGVTYYTWVKYADTPLSGMSDSPTGKNYIGLAFDKLTPTESTNYADYAWSLIKGEPGAPGADAVLVVVNASQQMFVSTDMGESFSPVEINIFPTFQHCSFSKWQYSVDGESFIDIFDYPDWATSTAYVIGNIITANGIQYECLVNHTSTTFEEDLVATPQLWNRLGYGISTVSGIDFTFKIAYDAMLFYSGPESYNSITFRLVGLENSVEYYDSISIGRSYNVVEAVQSVQSTVKSLDDNMTTVQNEMYYSDGTSKITALTTWQQTVDSFMALVQTGGGVNLLLNSVGYRTTTTPKIPFYEWSYYGTGLAEEEANSTFTLNSVSKHGMRLTGSGTLVQSRAIIPNRAMTLSARLSKIATEAALLIMQTNSTIDTGTATSGTTTTLVDTTKTWTTNYAGYQLRITSGTGAGQIRLISSSTTTTLTLAAANAFGVTPDATSRYAIESINDTITLMNTSDALSGLYTINIPATTVNETRITIKIQTTSAVSGLYVTDLMLAYGENYTEWQQASGETYNLNVLIDKSGIAVKSISVDSNGNEVITGETVMTPYEFAGYYQGSKIFTLNGDVTEVKKLSVETQIELNPVRMVALYSGATPISVDFVWMGDDA